MKLALLLLISTAALASPFEVVNGRPQLGADNTSFSFYWAVWRGLRPEEEKALKAVGEGALVSRRTIRWSTFDCATSARVHQSGERFWFLDDIRFDGQGRVIPIREAVRPGYRYLNLVTLNGIFLRGLPFEKPERRAGEKLHEYRERTSEAFDEWYARALPKGARGTVKLEAVYRLYPGAAQGAYVNLQDYLRVGSPLFERLRAYRPDAWPIYYDERAHKPHTLEVPTDWERADRLSEDRIHAVLTWNWCLSARPPEVTLRVPPGVMPPAGPTRPGRPDHGNAELSILESPDLAN